jgi:hypothetical protein
LSPADLIVSFGTAANYAAAKAEHLSWDEFAARLSAQPPESTDKASAGWYCPAEFKDNYRDSSNLLARYALTFDYDHIEPADVPQIEATYKAYDFVIYTTASHTKEKPRLRMVFPLAGPATLDEFCAVTRKFGERFSLEKLARESDVPAQMMFMPTRAPGGVFRARVNRGKRVDVDEILAEYTNWRDKKQWPHRLMGDSVHAVADDLKPPDEKPGIVGDFCRTWRVPEAIERFALPYVPGSNGRYTYTEGSRPDGLRLYDDGLKAHSSHDTDPAHGQNNAFDLVRLHKFGHLDSPEHHERPIWTRPSYQEMVALAHAQPEILSASVANDFVDLGPMIADAAPKEPETAVLARSLVDVLKSPSVPRWLLRDKIERGVIAVMAGPRGSYKSFIATDWGMQVAKNVGPVYTLSAEGADYDRRALAWLKANNESASNVQMFVAERRISLNEKDNIEIVRQDCLKLGIKPVMFILDTFSKLSGGLDENDNSQVKDFIGRLDNGLKRAFDATVLLIAHTGHSDKGRARGASALEADTDAAYIVTRHENAKNVSVTRQRFKSSPELEPLFLEARVIQLGYGDADGEPVSSLAMFPAVLTSAVTTASGPKLTWQQSAMMRTVEVALAGTPTGAMHSDQLIAVIVGTLVKPAEGRDTRKQLARRLLQGLADKECIHIHESGNITLGRAELQEEFE